MLPFVKSKFNALLAVATMTMAVNYAVMLSNSVVVGNLLGGVGLAGVNTVTPVFAVASFLASLLSVGSVLVFSREMGAFRAKEASGVFSQSMFLALALGATIFLAMSFFGDAFLDFTGVTDEIRLQAEHYWRYETIVLALTPSVLLLMGLVFADGDQTLALLAGGCYVSGSIGLSVLFIKLLGDAGGASAGTAVTMGLVLLVCICHFFRKENHLVFRRFFSLKKLGETIAASLADSTIYLCWGALILIINRFTVSRFGQETLPLVALAASVVEFSIVFDGVGEALLPLGGMYDGENNKPALRMLARHSALTATLEGALFGVVFFVLAPVLASLYGIRGESAALLNDATTLIRILAVAMPFMGLLMMLNTHFLVVRRVPFAVLVTIVKDFLFPASAALLLGSRFGTNGLWIGFSLGYACAAAFPFIVVRLIYGRDRYPWLIERNDGRAINFTIRVTSDGLNAARTRVIEFLTSKRIDASVTSRIVRQIEDVLAVVRDKNEKATIAEIFVDLSTESPRLILRDTGLAFNVPAEVVSHAASARYLNTLNCNRTEFLF